MLMVLFVTLFGSICDISNISYFGRELAAINIATRSLPKLLISKIEPLTQGLLPLILCKFDHDCSQMSLICVHKMICSVFYKGAVTLTSVLVICNFCYSRVRESVHCAELW